MSFLDTIDMCAAVCVDMCEGVHRCMRVPTGAHVDMCGGMCARMCTGMCINICADICVRMGADKRTLI